MEIYFGKLLYWRRSRNKNLIKLKEDGNRNEKRQASKQNMETNKTMNIPLGEEGKLKTLGTLMSKEKQQREMVLRRNEKLVKEVPMTQ